ncbi:aldo-keto reductase family 4 member C9-like [Planoprotostelium fungivorum]|uniref:Aldo-keto reductase family 4 member C9-like n=1 Tax=Planoprotostelium fungivorum TaxID=1890364 RepID=A0A2P6NDZ0_9EUKA|nr:aldo-keto reductase family 4 member C9-like [Planoprotostelium fungivorum]
MNACPPMQETNAFVRTDDFGAGRFIVDQKRIREGARERKMNKLNTGVEMPSVIVSTQKVYRDDAAPYTKAAIEAGHRHIDTAWIYGNEAEVGQGIKESGVERSQLFITSRIWALPARPESVSANLDRTLENLKIEHVDLCLMHWPLPGGSSRDPRAASLLLTWKVMERLYRSGKAKAIGVTNVTAEQLQSLLTIATVPISVCQADVSPTQFQQPLKDLCHSRSIHFWSAPPIETIETTTDGRTLTLTTFDVSRNDPSIEMLRQCIPMEAC